MTRDVALTAREEQCARLRAEGKTARQIAAALGISKGMVETHLRTGRERRGITARRQAEVASTLAASRRRLRVIPKGYGPADVARLCRILDDCGYEP